MPTYYYQHTMVKIMPEEKPKGYTIFKELGSLQEKVLFHLAENPRMNTQTIQKNLGYPPAQYPNILKAVKALEKAALIQSEEGKSKKNVPIRLYKCTQEGVFYALARNPNADVLKILDAYKSLDEFFKSMRRLYDVCGHDIFAKFVKDVDEFLPMIQRDGAEKAIPFMFMKIMVQLSDLDSKKRIEFVKETMKQFPHVREMLKEWNKAIKTVLEKT